MKNKRSVLVFKILVTNKLLSSLFFVFFINHKISSQDTKELNVIKINRVKDFYNCPLYKELEINNWRLTYNHKKTEAKSIMFFNDSTNKSVELKFKKVIKNSELPLPPPRELELKTERIIWRRKIKSFTIE